MAQNDLRWQKKVYFGKEKKKRIKEKFMLNR